ncbi:hypothetical protein ACVME8_008769 [Bradyrhizobium diazoefficiens]
MANGCTRRVVLGYGFLAAIRPGTGHSEEKDPLLATVDKPAIITARRAVTANAAANTRLQTIVSVVSYHPSADGRPIEVVVDGRVEGGPSHEIGRFGITPDREYAADDPSAAQRFLLPIPQPLAADVRAGKPITFTVRVVPVLGKGEGASLRVGTVEVP